MMKRIKELEKMLEEVCGEYEEKCNECPRYKECVEYIELTSELKTERV